MRRHRFFISFLPSHLKQKTRPHIAKAMWGRVIAVPPHFWEKDSLPHISVLSSNKLHDKVCRPNFYCFKFISSLVQFHKCPLPTSTNRELSIKFSFITFLIESIVNVSVSLVNTFLCFFWKRSSFPENSFSNGCFYKDWKPPSYWVFRHFFDIIY